MSAPRFTREQIAATAAGKLKRNAAIVGVSSSDGKATAKESKIVSLPPSTFDGQKLTMVLPLPDFKLHPNGRCHHMEKAKLVKDARELAWAETLACLGRAGRRGRLLWPSASALRRVYLANRRNADMDNLPGWTKAYVDGIADAGVVTNDRVITWGPDLIDADRCSPRVEIIIVRVDE